MPRDYTPIEDYSEQALARQIEFFKEDENFNKLIDVFAQIIQQYEDELYLLQELRKLENAEGVQLDGMGEFLLIERNNDSDDIYRSRIQTGIFEKTQGGQVETLISAYKPLVNASKVINVQVIPNTIFLTAIVSDLNILNQDVIYNAMQRVKAAGKELVLGVSLDESQAFTLGDAPDQFDPNTGLSSSSSGLDGGQLATAIGI